MLGVSYLAIKQWQVAALQPPHLAAMIPWEGMFDHYRDFFRHGGIFSSFFMKLLSGLADRREPERQRRAPRIATASPASARPATRSIRGAAGQPFQPVRDRAAASVRRCVFHDPDAAAGADHGAVPLRRQLGRARPASARQRDRLRAGGVGAEVARDAHRHAFRLDVPRRGGRAADAFLRPFPQGRGQWLRAGAAGPAHDPRSARLYPPQGARVAARAHRMGPLRAGCVDHGAGREGRSSGRERSYAALGRARRSAARRSPRTPSSPARSRRNSSSRRRRPTWTCS